MIIVILLTTALLPSSQLLSLLPLPHSYPSFSLPLSLLPLSHPHHLSILHSFQSATSLPLNKEDDGEELGRESIWKRMEIVRRIMMRK
jgi:hypothetical protein